MIGLREEESQHNVYPNLNDQTSLKSNDSSRIKGRKIRRHTKRLDNLDESDEEFICDRKKISKDCDSKSNIVLKDIQNQVRPKERSIGLKFPSTLLNTGKILTHWNDSQKMIVDMKLIERTNNIINKITSAGLDKNQSQQNRSDAIETKPLEKWSTDTQEFKTNEEVEKKLQAIQSKSEIKINTPIREINPTNITLKKSITENESNTTSTEILPNFNSWLTNLSSATKIAASATKVVASSTMSHAAQGLINAQNIVLNVGNLPETLGFDRSNDFKKDLSDLKSNLKNELSYKAPKTAEDWDSGWENEPISFASNKNSDRETSNFPPAFNLCEPTGNIATPADGWDDWNDDESEQAIIENNSCDSLIKKSFIDNNIVIESDLNPEEIEDLIGGEIRNLNEEPTKLLNQEQFVSQCNLKTHSETESDHKDLDRRSLSDLVTMSPNTDFEQVYSLEPVDRSEIDPISSAKLNPKDQFSIEEEICANSNDLVFGNESDEKQPSTQIEESNIVLSHQTDDLYLDEKDSVLENRMEEKFYPTIRQENCTNLEQRTLEKTESHVDADELNIDATNFSVMDSKISPNIATQGWDNDWESNEQIMLCESDPPRSHPNSDETNFSKLELNEEQKFDQPQGWDDDWNNDDEPLEKLEQESKTVELSLDNQDCPKSDSKLDTEIEDLNDNWNKNEQIVQENNQNLDCDLFHQKNLNLSHIDHKIVKKSEPQGWDDDWNDDEPLEKLDQESKTEELSLDNQDCPKSDSKLDTEMVDLNDNWNKNEQIVQEINQNLDCDQFPKKNLNLSHIDHKFAKKSEPQGWDDDWNNDDEQVEKLGQESKTEELSLYNQDVPISDSKLDTEMEDLNDNWNKNEEKVQEINQNLDFDQFHQKNLNLSHTDHKIVKKSEPQGWDDDWNDGEPLENLDQESKTEELSLDNQDFPKTESKSHSEIEDSDDNGYKNQQMVQEFNQNLDYDQFSQENLNFSQIDHKIVKKSQPQGWDEDFLSDQQDNIERLNPANYDHDNDQDFEHNHDEVLLIKHEVVKKSEPQEWGDGWNENDEQSDNINQFYLSIQNLSPIENEIVGKSESQEWDENFPSNQKENFKKFGLANDNEDRMGENRDEDFTIEHKIVKKSEPQGWNEAWENDDEIVPNNLNEESYIKADEINDQIQTREIELQHPEEFNDELMNKKKLSFEESNLESTIDVNDLDNDDRFESSAWDGGWENDEQVEIGESDSDKVDRNLKIEQRTVEKSQSQPESENVCGQEKIIRENINIADDLNESKTDSKIEVEKLETQEWTDNLHINDDSPKLEDSDRDRSEIGDSNIDDESTLTPFETSKNSKSQESIRSDKNEIIVDNVNSDPMVPLKESNDNPISSDIQQESVNKSNFQEFDKNDEKQVSNKPKNPFQIDDLRHKDQSLSSTTASDEIVQQSLQKEWNDSWGNGEEIKSKKSDQTEWDVWDDIPIDKTETIRPPTSSNLNTRAKNQAGNWHQKSQNNLNASEKPKFILVDRFENTELKRMDRSKPKFTMIDDDWNDNDEGDWFDDTLKRIDHNPNPMPQRSILTKSNVPSTTLMRPASSSQNQLRDDKNNFSSNSKSNENLDFKTAIKTAAVATVSHAVKNWSLNPVSLLDSVSNLIGVPSAEDMASVMRDKSPRKSLNH
ncbi:hypothetical protein SSS_09642 [Sarcoptes scabiei]|uniref:Uncharacterized protein n=1 Tax=Sarcoptes scabiei TaxID=52283 RepID=A0A834RFI4_SARSC|nr:hypothetical protein SSS_09642 [Sarcoptes scabiei]